MRAILSRMLFTLCVTGCMAAPPDDSTVLTQGSAAMQVTRSNETYRLIGIELARYLESHRPNQSLTLQDLVAVAKDPSLPLKTRLAAKVAVEKFDFFETAAAGSIGAKDGRLSTLDANAVSARGLSGAPEPSPCALAFLGEVLLERFAELDRPPPSASVGLLEHEELSRFSFDPDSELTLAARAGNTLFSLFDTASQGQPTDLRIGMADLQSIVSRGAAMLESAELSSAVRGAYVRVSGHPGDPPKSRLELRLDWDDTLLQAFRPTFDGLENVVADVPGFGRVPLSHRGKQDGRDIYYADVTYQGGGKDPGAADEVYFSVLTNTGELSRIAKAERTNDWLGW